MTDDWTVFANFSRAYRAPGLSELFYSGITGRGVIIAKPDLTPEKSLNGDLGIRFVGKRFYAGIYGFLYSIDDLIDRYLVADKVYAYLNAEDVRIKGLEFEFEYFPVSGLKIFGNGALMDGKSRITGDPVNDIPPFRVLLGGRYQWRRLSFEISGLHQAEMVHPGAAEIAIPAYTYFQARIGYNHQRDGQRLRADEKRLQRGLSWPARSRRSLRTGPELCFRRPLLLLSASADRGLGGGRRRVAEVLRCPLRPPRAGRPRRPLTRLHESPRLGTI